MKEGTVIKSTGSWYQVHTGNEVVEARIKGRFRIEGIDTTNPVAVGDKVKVEVQDDGTAVIKDILPRKNYIIRKSANLSKRAHIIAANIDQAFLMATIAYPFTSTAFIDRFLVTAEAYHIPAVLLFNKIDLYKERESKMLNEVIAAYESIGYPCLKIVASDGDGVDKVKHMMQGKASMIAGHSGTGKSTLINQLAPELDIKTGEISSYHHTGKHTTTFAEMHELPFGGYIIDTPGIRGFGIIDLEKDELSHYFPEMRSRLKDCKFYNCKHINEPKCAVKEAVRSGEITEFRYQNYVAMFLEEEEDPYR